MKKWTILQKIIEHKLVAVLRGNSDEQVVEFANRSILGGMKSVEITFTVPNALRAIERLTAEHSDHGDVVIGAGTVLDTETARLAILAGAQFIVTPYFNEDVVRLCHRYQIPVMPGATTVKEVVASLESGADIIKLFPGDFVGPKGLSAIKGPIPQANLMPTGGVNLSNLKEWFTAGAAAVGVGSDLTKEAILTGDLDAITRKAFMYVSQV